MVDSLYLPLLPLLYNQWPALLDARLIKNNIVKFTAIVEKTDSLPSSNTGT